MAISIRSRCLSFLLLLIALPAIGHADTICDLTLPAMGRADEKVIPTLGWEHEILSPRDTTPTTSSGERQHEPFVVVKAVDDSSADLMEAFYSGEVLPDRVLLDCTGTEDGQETHHFTIELVDATVSRIRMEMLSDRETVGSFADSPQMVEEIELTYEAIEYRFSRQGGHMTVVEDYQVETATADSGR